MALTAKNKLFLEEYVANHYNATQAYITIYGCEYDTASNRAHKILKFPEAKEYMKEIQKERVERLNITADRIMEELSSMAFSEKTDENVGASAKLKALDLLQKQMGLQTQKVDANVNAETTIEVKLDED